MKWNHKSITIMFDGSTSGMNNREEWEWLIDEYLTALTTHDYDYAKSVIEDLNHYDVEVIMEHYE